MLEPTEGAGAIGCSHLVAATQVAAATNGCQECMAIGQRWIHLRICMSCGHVGCCDSSPGRHATAHFGEHRDHPLMRSFEPGENWWWCYIDEITFDVPGASPAPSHS